eukprot:TRINITY_DN11087_c0_g1_i3.p1 TRINITY_DN11087_c0_g1~~TRINITY_DN11087_c0_g1_i3.p1  ORF type:complete len:279 (-),score=93.11 TRINITY_DN11087_c0_g1_i3:99-896(-)
MYLSMLPRVLLPFQASKLVLQMQVRHAGHNKWSNIRHIKGARDQLDAKKIILYTAKISIAIKNNGGNTNPEANRGLKKIVEEALAQQVPKTTVERILKNYKINAEESNEFLIEVRGPGRVGVLVECLAKKKAHLDVRLNPIFRRCGSTQEFGVINMFEKKGIIVTDMKKGQTFDDAESDAIEVGAEEVNLADEETSILEFITDEYDLFTVSGELTKAGYNCKEASISYIPNTEGSMNVMEAKTYEKLVDMLMEEEVVIAVHSNAT